VRAFGKEGAKYREKIGNAVVICGKMNQVAHHWVGLLKAVRGPSEQWCYDVVMLSQTCYDLFDLIFLVK